MSRYGVRYLEDDDVEDMDLKQLQEVLVPLTKSRKGQTKAARH